MGGLLDRGQTGVLVAVWQQQVEDTGRISTMATDRHPRWKPDIEILGRDEAKDPCPIIGAAARPVEQLAERLDRFAAVKSVRVEADKAR